MAFFMKLTAAGAAKLAAAQAGGTMVSLTNIALGDGNGNAVGEPTGTETTLIREVYRAAIAALYVNPNDSTMFMAELTVPSGVGGWAVREIGIYDSDSQLFAYGNFPDTYKPTADMGSTRDMVIVCAIKVSNSDLVQLVIDANIVLASRQWVLSTITTAYLIPGGLTNQFLAKNSNADGDVKWVDITEGINVVVDVVQEVQTLAAMQTTVNFAILATTGGLGVYIEGVRLIQGIDYVAADDDTIELTTSYPAGSRLHAYQNDPLEPVSYMRPGLNLSDVSSVSAARNNLGIYSKAEIDAKFAAAGKLYFIAQI